MNADNRARTDHPAEAGVSVIIPLYNKGGTIARAISSVLRQTGANKEVIVVDDGSTDHSSEIAKSFGDRIIYVKQTNQGPSAARNYGATLGKYSKLVFLDADDELMVGCLAAHVSCRVDNPHVDLSLASFRVMDGQSILREEILTQRLTNATVVKGVAFVDGFAAKLVVNVASGAICVDKKLFESAGQFDPVLRCWEITDLMYRLALQHTKMAVLQDYLVTIHDNKTMSHFQELRDKPEYLVRFAERLLDRVLELPEDQKDLIFEKVAIILSGLAISREARAFKRLAARACRHAAVTERIDDLCSLSQRSLTAVKVYFYLRSGKYRKFSNPADKPSQVKKCVD